MYLHFAKSSFLPSSIVKSLLLTSQPTKASSMFDMLPLLRLLRNIFPQGPSYEFTKLRLKTLKFLCKQQRLEKKKLLNRPKELANSSLMWEWAEKLKNLKQFIRKMGKKVNTYLLIHTRTSNHIIFSNKEMILSLKITIFSKQAVSQQLASPTSTLQWSCTFYHIYNLRSFFLAFLLIFGCTFL